MGNALSHVLIPVRANLEYGTSGIVSSHGLIGSVNEARVIDVRIHAGSCGEAGSPHTIMLPSLMVSKVKLTGSASSGRMSSPS